MTYSEPLISQLNYFLLSLGFGVFIELWYICVMFIRKCISEKRCAVVVGDLIFTITVSVASFFFMVHYNNGQIRLNLIVGQLMSAVVLHFLFGSKILRLLNKPTQFVRRMIYFFTIPQKTYLNLFPIGIKKIKNLKTAGKRKTDKKVRKNRKKFNFITKIYLKNKNKSV